MNLLALETSGPVLSVAIKKGKQKARELTLKGYFRHAENLLPLIDRLLKKEKLKPKDLDLFLVGRGPGSFTGLRVGFATLIGLNAIQKKPCSGALSLDLIAGKIPASKGQNLCVCLDAKRGKLYARFYRYDGKKWIPRKAASALSMEAIVKQAAAGSLFAGDGMATDKNSLLKNSHKKFVLLPEKYGSPKASTLIEYFERKDPALQVLRGPKDLLPFYIRSSEAEERLRDKKK